MDMGGSINALIFSGVRNSGQSYVVSCTFYCTSFLYEPLLIKILAGLLATSKRSTIQQ